MRFRPFLLVLILVAATALLPLSAMAEDEHAEHAERAGDTEPHGEEGHHFKNAISLFLGVTNEPGHGTEPTWGLEYGRALSPRWTVGGLIDYAGGAQRNLVIAPMVIWKPLGGGFFLLAAPGVEYHDGRGEVDHHLFKASTASEDKDKTYFVFRIGAGYAFHVGSRYGIVPTVNLDFVDGHEVWVYGVNFEVMF